MYLFSSDIVQLEQDTVLGVESLLMLCSQDSSPSAQATLKVRHFNQNAFDISWKNTLGKELHVEPQYLWIMIIIYD